MKFAKFLLFCACVATLGACNSGSTASSENSTLTVVGSTSQTDSDLVKALQVFPPNPDVTPIGSPTLLNISAYAFYVSANADCTDAQLVGGDGTTAEEFDLISSPTLFTAELAAGDYQCLIFKMSDLMTFRVDATAAAAFDLCTEDEDHSFDIYRSDSGEETPWVDIDGSDITATGTASSPSSDIVTIFASTDPDAVIAALGANANQVGTLSGALSVPGTVTFYVDATNGILGDEERCAVEEMAIGFR